MSLSNEDIKKSSESLKVRNPSVASEPLPEFIDVIKTGETWEFGKAMFSEYCECSTIHGVRYLGERKRSWTEKIFWLVIFSISIYICCVLIGDIWTKWNNIPVIVSFSDKSTPIWNIPMPTFTICPDIKSNSTIFRFDELEIAARENISVIDQWTKQQKKYMDVNLQVCDYTKHDYFNFPDKFYPGNFLKELKNLAPKPDELFPRTRFDNEMIIDNYKRFFDIVLTEMGVCYSFNLLPLENIYRRKTVSDDLINFAHDGDVEEDSHRYDRYTQWTQQNGYEGEASGSPFPFRMYNAHSENGLLLLIYGSKHDVDPVCGAGDEGFKFSITTPGDIPQLSKQYSSVPFNYEVLIDITPELITTSDTAADFSPKIRRCFYDSEKYLKYFQVYSEANCELECLTNYTMKKCGCVRFNMPRAKKTRVCGAGSINCYQEAKRELMENDFRSDSQNVTSLQMEDCNCLPSCTSLSYSFGITQAPLQSVVEDDDDYKITSFKLYFKDNRFWSSERSKLYGIIEFTANAGGLLGLFMGISILSFVELFYFVSVRLLGNIKLRYCSEIKDNISRNVSELSRKISLASETGKEDFL